MRRKKGVSLPDDEYFLRVGFELLVAEAARQNPKLGLDLNKGSNLMARECCGDTHYVFVDPFN